MLAATLFCALAGPILCQEPAGGAAQAHTTESGLRYEVLQEGGAGPHPRLGDRVRVHYTGQLTDGTVFDSSRERGQPAEFVLGQVIPGWNEGLQLMTPGARYKFTIPSKLGYGSRGAPPRIPPDATLIFDVELLEVFQVPAFRQADAEAQKETTSGLKYEVLASGEGPSPSPEDVMVLRYTCWTRGGELVMSSIQTGRPLRGRAEEMPLPFLKEVGSLLRLGGRLRCEVPGALGFGSRSPSPRIPANADTVWEIELLRLLKPLPVPVFAGIEEDRAEKTATGLRYQVLKEGTGERPKLGDTVVVHYAGWLTDGTLFDSSYGRGEPAEFVLGRVIQGWNEGLQLMQEGAVYRFEIPAALAYGSQGAPPKIPPGATLVFQVELLDVKAP